MTSSALTLGAVIQTQKGFAFKSSWFNSNGSSVPVIKVTNFTENSISVKDCVKVNEAVAKNYERFRLSPGDVIIQTVGSWPSNPASVVGRCVRVPSNLNNALLNQNAVVVKPTDGIDQSYLYYLLRDDSFKNYIIGTAQGAASQAAITLESIRAYKFDLPEKLTQKKLGATLSNFDDLMENNSQRIEKLESMARLLYRDTIQDVVSTTSLGTKLTIKKGKNITKATIKKGGVPVVAGGLSPAYYHDTANTESPVITVSASGANAGYVNLYHQDIWASDCSFIDKNVTPYIYYYFTLMTEKQNAITHLQKGSAQPHVYPADLERLEIPDLSDKTIAELSGKLNPIYELIRNLVARNDILGKARDMLLPRLMSGEIEL